MKKIKKAPILIIVISLVCFLNSCETWREDCVGYIIVENEIPDTTLYVGGEPFIRDISDLPVVFSHTKKEISVIEVMALDNSIVRAGSRLNKNDEFYLIYVEARKAGETEIYVTAKDECMDYLVSTSFNVTVIDTTTS